MGPPESGVSAPPERAPGADGPSPTGEQEPWRPPPLRSASHPTQPPSRALRGLRRRRLPAPGFEVALLATDSALLVPRRALADRVVCAATAVAELAHRALSDGVVRTAAIEAVARALLALLLGLGLRAVRLAADLTEMALLTADATLLVDEAAVRLGMAGGAATETDVIRLRDLRLGLRLRLRFRLRLLAARTGVVAHNLQVADLATDRTLLVFELAILLCMARLAAATTRLRPRPIGGVRLTAHRHQVAQLAANAATLVLVLAVLLLVPGLPAALAPNLLGPSLLRLPTGSLQMADLAANAASLLHKLALLLLVAPLPATSAPHVGHGARSPRCYGSPGRCLADRRREALS
mmetsp:Transcript_119254/g.344949  ORF Transcript_119254/g.344949 Transcript_119254/m.344949 type:complete len:352 (-) Transcript_119254:18-1073(-)